MKSSSIIDKVSLTIRIGMTLPQMSNYDLRTTTILPLLEAIPRDEFTFVINQTIFPTTIVEAVGLSPSVRDQLQVDACTRRYVICDSKIDSTNFSSLQNLLSGSKVVFQKSDQKSLILLSQQLCNVGLEQFFFSLWGDSTDDVTVTHSNAFAARSRVDLKWVSNLLLLSVDALDDLLSTESFMVNSEDALLRILQQFQCPVLLRHIQWEFLSPGAITTIFKDPGLCNCTELLWRSVSDRLTHPPLPPGLDSRIVSQFPRLFEEFQSKQFKLLWRGSRDGFNATEFHRRCDGHANTLTFILDTKDNVFGGFTPVKWESRTKYPYHKSDDSMLSFLFTLKNPHNVPSRKFVLKSEKNQFAICCRSESGPIFGYDSYNGYDIFVSDNCNESVDCFTRIGTRWNDRTYANDTTVGDFLTGSFNFTVKEIEVFEITK
jgi:hypothetical protein